MSVTQTVEIPASHRLTIDVPPEVPAGPVILTFTPRAAESVIPSMKQADSGGWVNPLWGRARARGSKLTLERFMEMQRKDAELENELEKRLWKDKS